MSSKSIGVTSAAGVMALICCKAAGVLGGMFQDLSPGQLRELCGFHLGDNGMSRQ